MMNSSHPFFHLLGGKDELSGVHSLINFSIHKLNQHCTLPLKQSVSLQITFSILEILRIPVYLTLCICLETLCKGTLTFGVSLPESYLKAVFLCSSIQAVAFPRTL